MVVVILGGNSITSALSNTETKQKDAAFYALLKPAAKPTYLKLPVQTEPRFVPEGNLHGTPPAVECNQRLQIINDFVNKRLKKQGLVDRVIQLGSAAFINEPLNYWYGVHLNRAGLERYKQAVVRSLDIALSHRQ